MREAGATLRTRQGAVRLSLGGMKASETSLRAPFPRSWWVEDGALLAGCYPGARDADGARRRLSALLDFGVAAVVNLMEEGETDHDWAPFRPYEEELRGLAEERDREGGVAGQGRAVRALPDPGHGGAERGADAGDPGLDRLPARPRTASCTCTAGEAGGAPARWRAAISRGTASPRAKRRWSASGSCAAASRTGTGAPRRRRRSSGSCASGRRAGRRRGIPSCRAREESVGSARRETAVVKYPSDGLLLYSGIAASLA